MCLHLSVPMSGHISVLPPQRLELLLATFRGLPFVYTRIVLKVRGQRNGSLIVAATDCCAFSLAHVQLVIIKIQGISTEMNFSRDALEGEPPRDPILYSSPSFLVRFVESLNSQIDTNGRPINPAIQRDQVYIVRGCFLRAEHRLRSNRNARLPQIRTSYTPPA